MQPVAPAGVILAVDPGSRNMGLAWFTQDGILKGTAALASKAETWGQRFIELYAQMQGMFKKLKLTVSTVVIEQVPNSSHPGLKAILGLVLAHEACAGVNISDEHFINPSSWKAVARKAGANAKDPKGVAALEAIVGEMPADMTDDEADAALIGITYFLKKQEASAKKVKKANGRAKNVA